MSPATHLFASWLIAAKTTPHPRDCRLVALGGLLPDLDGLGLLVDPGAQAAGDDRSSLYTSYHHFLLHGLPAGLVITPLFPLLARDRPRVALLCLALFHSHLFFDVVGSLKT